MLNSSVASGVGKERRRGPWGPTTRFGPRSTIPPNGDLHLLDYVIAFRIIISIPTTTSGPRSTIPPNRDPKIYICWTRIIIRSI